MLNTGFFQSDLDALKDYAVRYYTGIHVMPEPHIHSHYEMYFCPENIFQRSVINGVEYDYKYPCAIISKPYTIHSMSCLETGGVNYDRYVISINENKIDAFDTSMLSRILESNGMGLFFRLSNDEASYIEDLFRTIFFHEKFKMENSEYEAAISLILTKIYNFSKNGRIIEVGSAESYVQKALRFISESFTDNIDSQSLADRFSVSRSKLDRDFRAATGTTPKIFLDTCRFNRAKYLLRTHAEMTVGEIAESIGFSNVTYFFRFFSKYEGISPNVYRKLHSNVKE